MAAMDSNNEMVETSNRFQPVSPKRRIVKENDN
jgi:hypothetical protein